MESTKDIIKNRPAFLVDEHLKKAAKKAAEAFMSEEEELKTVLQWSDLKKAGY